MPLPIHFFDMPASLPAMSSLIALRRVTLPHPSGVDRRSDDQRLRDALGLEPLDIPISVLRKGCLQTGVEFSCVVGRGRNVYKLIDVAAEASYSIALDIGTTNLVASLCDNVSQKIITEAKMENPQIYFGSDILTRMHHAMTGHAKELCQSLLDGVNSMINVLCRNAGIDAKDIHSLVAAGNTVMSHFFLGLDISRIPVAPFTPVVRKPGFFKASDIGLEIHPEALVYVFPNAGSYVGGDIVAGIVASGIFDSDEPAVLIDVGTNAEVVVGNRDWLIVGAGAAGPALEEGIALVGKRAESGIIYDVEIKNGIVECRTFGNSPPDGICGSGMVSLIYEMYVNGIIGNDGILKGHKDVSELKGERLFTLRCAPDNRLVITQREIDNFLRSKAAMFTLLLVLLRSVDLRFGDIQKIYIAGALGNGIDVRKAAGIGMLPEWPPDRVLPVGNTSLKGAQMALRDSSILDREDEITDGITYKHMHDDPEFMKEFQGAVFIPHTSPDLLKI